MEPTTQPGAPLLGHSPSVPFLVFIYRKSFFIALVPRRGQRECSQAEGSLLEPEYDDSEFMLAGSIPRMT